LDGIVELDQVTVSLRRALLFRQIYGYGDELYVGWDAHLNTSQWVEKRLRTGRHKETGELTEVKSRQWRATSASTTSSMSTR
jgi:hypothetical protein